MLRTAVAYLDLVISVRVLHLFYKNESGYCRHIFIAETMFKFLISNYSY